MRAGCAIPISLARPASSASALLARGLAAIVLAFGAGLMAAEAADAAHNPGASTGAVSNLTPTSAVLHGVVTPRGPMTDFVFQYGTSRRYTAQTPLAPAGSGTKPINVNWAIFGLSPNTVYHYQVVALSGTSTPGGDRTFVTPKIPFSLAIAPAPNPVLFGNSFLVNGTLSGTGAAGRRILLRFNPFPYTGGFRTVSDQLTSATGSFSFFAPGVLENTQMVVSMSERPRISSPVVTEGVAVSVSLHVRHTNRRGFVRFFGTVTPAEAGALVGFQLLVPHHNSVNVGGTGVKAAAPTFSRFNRVIHIPHTGFYKALVQIFDPAHVSGRSGAIFVR
jgi:hypothetical protein